MKQGLRTLAATHEYATVEPLVPLCHLQGWPPRCGRRRISGVGWRMERLDQSCGRSVSPLERAVDDPASTHFRRDEVTWLAFGMLGFYNYLLSGLGPLMPS